MTDTSDRLIACATADEADRALGLGFAIETTPEVAAECGAPRPGESDPADGLEDALEAFLHPHGDGEADSSMSGHAEIRRPPRGQRRGEERGVLPQGGRPADRADRARHGRWTQA